MLFFFIFVTDLSKRLKNLIVLFLIAIWNSCLNNFSILFSRWIRNIVLISWLDSMKNCSESETYCCSLSSWNEKSSKLNVSERMISMLWIAMRKMFLSKMYENTFRNLQSDKCYRKKNVKCRFLYLIIEFFVSKFKRIKSSSLCFRIYTNLSVRMYEYFYECVITKCIRDT